MLKKLFGGKKSGYFLELKEEDSQQKKSKPEAPAQPKAEKPTQVKTEVPVIEEKSAEPEPKSTKSKKTSIKGKKSAAPKEKKAKKEEKQPASDSVPMLTPFPASTTAASQNGKVEPQEVAFASKNLITPTMSRRRPGPSLNTFKTMARQVKKPARG